MKIERESNRFWICSQVGGSEFYYKISKRTGKLRGYTHDFNRKTYKGYAFDMYTPSIYRLINDEWVEYLF
jgi:hypothetical protein